jgi:ubiquinone biosynthesis protein COQ9
MKAFSIFAFKYAPKSIKRHNSSQVDFKLRNDILELALQNVPTSGWTNDSIAKAVQTIGLPTLSHSIIERGAVELVEHFLEKKRKHVFDTMTTNNNTSGDSSDGNKQNPDEVLIKAIETHFDYIQPYLSDWSSALALLVDPNHISYQTFTPILDVVDDLCHFTDIKVSRLNWYSERGMLACLYGSTEMYLLTDKSENLQETK